MWKISQAASANPGLALVRQRVVLEVHCTIYKLLPGHGYLTFATPSRNRDMNLSLIKPRYLVCKPLVIKINTQDDPTTDPANRDNAFPDERGHAAWSIKDKTARFPEWSPEHWRDSV